MLLGLTVKICFKSFFVNSIGHFTSGVGSLRIFIGSFAYNVTKFLRKHFDDACSEVVFNSNEEHPLWFGTITAKFIIAP